MDPKNLTPQTSLELACSQYEQASAELSQLRGLGKNLLPEQFDRAQRALKGAKDAAEKEIQAAGNCLAACTLATKVITGVTGTGDAARQRRARRRSWLKGVIGRQYTDYKIVWDKDTARFSAENLGDEIDREASAMATMLLKWAELGKPSTQDAIAAALRHAAATPSTPVVEPQVNASGLYRALADSLTALGIVPGQAAEVKATEPVAAAEPVKAVKANKASKAGQA